MKAQVCLRRTTTDAAPHGTAPVTRYLQQPRPPQTSVPRKVSPGVLRGLSYNEGSSVEMMRQPSTPVHPAASKQGAQGAETEGRAQRTPPPRQFWSCVLIMPVWRLPILARASMTGKGRGRRHPGRGCGRGRGESRLDKIYNKDPEQ